MGKYIDAEKIKYSYIPLAVMPDVFVTKKEIDEMPSEDVATVVHAHWIVCGMFDDFLKCSKCECKHTAEMVAMENWSYCPRCGSKMDEVEQ